MTLGTLEAVKTLAEIERIKKVLERGVDSVTVEQALKERIQELLNQL